MAISSQLKMAIRAAEKTQSLYEIGHGSGVVVSNLYRFLSGERGLALSSVDRLAEYLGLELTPKRKPRRAG